MNDVETMVRDALRQRAERTAVRPAPAFAPREGRRRSRVPLVAAAAAAIAAVVAGVVVLGDGDSPARVAVQTPEPTEPAAPLPPRYVVDLPGAMVTQAESQVYDAGVGGEPGWHVQSFVGDAGFAGPQLHLLTAPPPDDGYVDDVDTTFQGGERITVQGEPARLLEHHEYVAVWWPNDAEPGVLVQAWALSRAEVLAVVEGLARRAGRAGWDLSYVPEGLVARADDDRTARPIVEGTTSYSAGYQLASGSMYSMTAIVGAGPTAFDDLVANRIGGAAAVEAIEVGDQPAILLHPRADNVDYTVLWQPAEGTTAELFATHVPVDELRAVLAALRPASEEEWVRDASLPSIPPGTVRDR